MRAVNLIPDEHRRPGGGVRVPQSPAAAVIACLALILAFVTIYVLSSNTVAARQAKVATLQAQITQQQSLAGRLSGYAQFAQLTRTRTDTVRRIAAARFDWHRAFSDLSKVVPASTALSAMSGSVVPGSSAVGSGSSGGPAQSLRGAISAPALVLSGCSKTQDDVARLMSRLRVMQGVTRVTLDDSVKPGGTSSSAATAAGCGPTAPTFDLVVFYAPLAGAGSTGFSTGGSVAVGASATPGTPR